MRPVHSCFRALLALSLLLCLPATPSSAEATAPGNGDPLVTASAELPTATVPVTIAADTTLTSDRTWLVPNPVKVNSGVTLTIEPGTTVKFDAGSFLMIEGTLVADGAGGSPIILTSGAENPVPGAWGGSYGFNPTSIAFVFGSEPAVFDTNGEYVSGSILRHAVLEYGMGISCLGAAPLIEGNQIRYNGSSGIGAVVALTDSRMGPGDPAPVIRGNTITDNTGVSAYLVAPETLFSGNLLARNEGPIYASANVSILTNLITETLGSPSLGGVPGQTAVRVNGGEFRGNAVYANQTDYDLAYEGLAGSTQDISGNYWGTTSEEEIEERIHHGNDSFALGMAVYTPFLTEAPPDVPAFLSNLTVGPESPVGLGQASFTLHFSAPMDQSIAPVVSFHPTRRGTWTQYTRENSGLPMDTINAIAESADGSIWIATDGGGAARFDGETWVAYSAHTSGLGDNRVFSVATTERGEVWFGLSGRSGIVASRYDGSDWKAYSGVDCEDLDPGLIRMAYSYGDPEPVEWLCDGYSMAADTAGSVWFASYGVVQYDGSTWHLHDSSSGLPDGWIESVATGRDGTVWAITEEGAIARLDGAEWSVYDQSNSALLATWVTDIAVASDGTTWIGGYGGLTKVDGTEWTWLPGQNSYDPEGPPYYPARLAVGPDDALWTTSEYYAVRHDGHDWVYYETPARSTLRDIIVDRNGNAWVGGGSGGLQVLWAGHDYNVNEGGRWLDDRTWQATYDVTSLLQRGEYTVSVGGVQALGGWVTQPDSRFTFTIDYPGTITDTTPPPAPNLYASGVLGDPSAVYARWSATDPDSQVTAYRYAIGTSPGGTDIVGWTETADMTLSQAGLGLAPDGRYWLTVEAGNIGGLWSEPTYMAFAAGQVSPGNVYLPLASR